jgi:hypothetical protein
VISNREHVDVCETKTDGWFASWVTAIFVVVTCFILPHHTFFRDEVQAWMIAKHSASLAELLSNVRYEGHPVLWHLLLYGLTRLTPNLFWMQVLHLAISAGVIWIFACFAPFTRLQRFLFAFGYFPFYLYSVICRCYALGILLLFVVCACFAHRRRKTGLLAAFLALASFVSAYTWIMAASLAATVVLALIIDREKEQERRSLTWQTMIITVLLAGAFLGSASQIIPPSDSGVYTSWHFGGLRGVGSAFASLASAFLLLPNVVLQWHIAVAPMEIRLLQAVFGLLIFVWALLLVAPRPAALFFLASYFAAALFFAYSKHTGCLRHNAHFYYALFIGLWIAHQSREVPIGNRFVSSLSRLCRSSSPLAITILLFWQVAVGVWSMTVEYRHPLSAGKATAEYILRNGLADLPIAGAPDFAVSTVSAYLDRPVYYLNSKQLGTFVIWNDSREEVITHEEMLDRLFDYVENMPTDVILVLNYRLSDAERQTLEIGELANFDAYLQLDESFYIYRVPSRS